MTLRLIGAMLCLVCGILLWNNLALHFAEIEEVLPYLQLSDLARGESVFFIFIALALIVAVAIVGKLPLRRLFSGPRRPVRTLSAVIIFGISFVPLFWLRFGGAAWAILLLIGIAFFLNAVGLLILSSWLAERVRISTVSLPRLMFPIHPWLPGILLLAAASYGAYHCFGLIPHVEDSIAQLLQARIFASGHAAVEPFYPQEFFFYGFMVDMGRWFSQYPPGHPLALAIGVLLGAPYFVNPALGLGAVIIFYFLLKDLEGETFARWGVWLMVLSPFVIFMHAGFMNHTTALAASLIGWLGLKKGERGHPGWLWLSGLGFGYCAATRPLDGAVFALIGGVYLLYSFGGIKFSSFVKVIPYVAAFSIAASLYLAHNWLTTGHPFKTGYTLTWGGNGFGFGAKNWGPPHTFGYGLVNSFMSIAGLNVYFYEIPVPALLGVFIWALWGRKMNRWDRTFLAAMILIPCGYLFYYFHDYCFGPRYYYVIVPMLIYFSIKGVQVFYHHLQDQFHFEAATLRSGMIWAGIVLLGLQLWIAVPYRASVYASGYWGVDDGPMKEAQRLKLNNAIVFIENYPWEVLQTKLHSLGFKMGDAHRLLFTITADGLNEVLTEMGVDPDSLWNTTIDLQEFEERAKDWNERYLKAGNAPVDPWKSKKIATYYSNGAVHLDPRNRQPNVILARDLGNHNGALTERYPDRKAYRYAYDKTARRFRILPLH